MDRQDYDQREGQLHDADLRRRQRERFLPPTDEEVRRTLAARKEAKDGPKRP